jgi:hypothetical protein
MSDRSIDSHREKTSSSAPSLRIVAVEQFWEVMAEELVTQLVRGWRLPGSDDCQFGRAAS